MSMHYSGRVMLAIALTASSLTAVEAAESWTQLKYDSRHSGDVSDRQVTTPLGLVAAVPMTDAILTSPAVAHGRIYVVDAAGVLSCLDAGSHEVLWRYRSGGGAVNCSNVSSPAVVDRYVHFGTSSGRYCVVDALTGQRVVERQYGGPIFGAPVVGPRGVYFATLGARLYAVTARGEPRWEWDFVAEVLGFTGDRWSGAAWREFKDGRVTWRDHFCCSRNLSVHDSLVVMPAGGRTVCIEDAGDAPRLRTVGIIPDFAGREYPAAFGQSMDAQGRIYVQWHRRDNAGRVEVLELDGDELKTSFVPGTQTAIQLPGLLSFSSVSVRGDHIYRCRPEEGLGLCRHSLSDESTVTLHGAASITAPVLLAKHAVYGGLDGRLYVVRLDAPEDAADTVWSFRTAFDRPITAPAAVAGGRIYFGCEDGYLYVLGPSGQAALPTQWLGLEKIRSPLTGKYADSRYDWFTNYGDLAATNANQQEIAPPLKIKWIRRYPGTFKHLPTCGGGRMYTHTAEGQVFAVEQESGRLLWRRYWPHVHLSFTAPIYHRHNGRELLLVPQAGIKQSRLRCLDAGTGELYWEVPFTGSPSWSRQAPPIVYRNLAIYASGSGQYAAQGTERAFVMKGDPRPSDDGREVMSWIYTHNNPYYPHDNRPLIWAWDLDTGRVVWTRDFSEHGRGGNDCGLCLMDGTLYYSTFFGYSATQRERRGLPGGPNGITAALDPLSGNVRWLTDKVSVTAGCTISGRDGRLYVGGYNQPDESTQDRYVFCLDARDGRLVWKSDPVKSAVNVVTITDDFIFSNASGRDGHVIDITNGKILSRFNYRYACTRFTCSGSYVMGSNMDMIDLSDGNRLVSTGPCIDSRECVGATVSNGRIFYTSQASGLQVSQVGGREAGSIRSPWEAPDEGNSP